jgi:predicted phosphoadenosine phosphosulfate sulfurtransferase
MPRTYTDKDVYSATTERLDFVFVEFEKVYISFSRGEDSGVLLNLAIEPSRRAGKLPLDVLLVDLEDEVLRRKQITGLTEAFKDQEFSKSWE